MADEFKVKLSDKDRVYSLDMEGQFRTPKHAVQTGDDPDAVTDTMIAEGKAAIDGARSDIRAQVVDKLGSVP